MLRQLDWRTPLRRADIGGHWRVVLSVVVGVAVSTLVWACAFPHAFWFLLLWIGGATGGTVGALVGFVWQARVPERRASTSGRLAAVTVLGWGGMSVVGFLLLMPMFRAEAAERARLRALRTEDIAGIELRFEDRTVSVDRRESIREFADLCSRAEPFYPSHEGYVTELDIRIRLADGSVLAYRGGIRERHRGDLSLDFLASTAWSQVLLPRGGAWLARAIEATQPHGDHRSPTTDNRR